MFLKVDLIAEKLDVKSLSSFSASRDGSPEHDVRNHPIEAIRVSKDRMKAMFLMKNFGKGDSWLNRVFQLELKETKILFEIPTNWDSLACYYTLRTIPK